MTSATIHPEYNPGTPPLLAVAAVLATALTMGIAVLLPTTRVAPVDTVASVPVVAQRVEVVAPANAQSAPVEAPAIAQSAQVEAPMPVVTLPAIDVVGTRPTKSAANRRWGLHTSFKP